jgi:hypothetical protein
MLALPPQLLLALPLRLGPAAAVSSSSAPSLAAQQQPARQVVLRWTGALSQRQAQARQATWA